MNVELHPKVCFPDLGLDILWKIAVLKSNRRVVLVDQFIDHVADQVARFGRNTVCQALERCCGEFELTFWDNLASRFDRAVEVLVNADLVKSLVFATNFKWVLYKKIGINVYLDLV